MPDEGARLRRFSPVQRLWHVGLVLVFMILSVTGIAWMFVETPWGRGLASLFGGYKGALEVHRITGLVLLAGFAAHIAYLLAKVRWRGLPRSLLGPETLVFQWVDARQFLQHLLWIVGLAGRGRGRADSMTYRSSPTSSATPVGAGAPTALSS